MKLIIWDFRNTLFNTDTKEFNEGAIDALNRFKDSVQILVTASNSAEERIKEIQKLEIDKFFEEVIISNKTREIFEHLMKGHDASPEDTLIIGDQYSSEIAIGNDLGVKTIWFANGNPDEQKLGIKYWKKIRSLKELLDLEF